VTEFFNAFGVDVFKLAFQIVNFVLLLWLLRRFAYKPVLGMLDERRRRISKGLEDAEAAERDRALASAEREAAVAEARKEAQAMIARATKIAEESRAEIMADAKAEADRLIGRAREEIIGEKEKAMAELRGTVANLALDAAGKLVRAEMSGATQKRLVDDFLKEVKPTSGGKASS
jgi:F-type H+-transporting ATPase subunit b